MDGFTYTTQFADLALRMEDEAIKRDFPEFKRMPSLRGTGVWLGQLRPMAQTYEVRLAMSFGSADADLAYPRHPSSVRVLGSAVRPAASGTPVPHLYGSWDDPRGAHLCLYYPPDEIMVPGEQAAPKLLPWAYEWLHYYELWLVTGVWSGPAAPHDLIEPTDVVPSAEDRPRRVSLPRGVRGALMRCMTYHLNQERPVLARSSAIAA